MELTKTGSLPSTIAPLLTPAQVFSAFTAVLYGCTSLLMVFLNKGLLMNFPYPLTVLTLQMAFSAFLVQLGSLSGFFSIRPLSLSTAKAIAPLSFLYNANVVFALASLQGVNIPMYSALKRLNPLGVCAINHMLGKPRPPLEELSSVLFITLGCLVAAMGDFSLDLPSYAMAMASVFFQCSYLVLVERSGAEEGMSSSELLLYNSLLSLPVLGVMISVTGEGSSSFPLILNRGLSSPGFVLALCLVLGMGCFLNFTVFLCTLLNSALTTTVVGVLKSAASTALGFFVFGGVGWETHSNVGLKVMFVVGHMLNTGGGVWYTVARYKQKQAKKKGVEGGGSRLGGTKGGSQALKESGDEILLPGKEKHKEGGEQMGVRGTEEESEAQV